MYWEVERVKWIFLYFNEIIIEVEDFGNIEDFFYIFIRIIFEVLNIVGFKLVLINFYLFVYRVKY